MIAKIKIVHLWEIRRRRLVFWWYVLLLFQFFMKSFGVGKRIFFSVFLGIRFFGWWVVKSFRENKEKQWTCKGWQFVFFGFFFHDMKRGRAVFSWHKHNFEKHDYNCCVMIDSYQHQHKRTRILFLLLFRYD